MPTIVKKHSLRALRESHVPRLTYQDLGSKAGLSWGTIFRIEHGHNVPRVSTRAAIAAVLGVEPWEIHWPGDVDDESPN